MILNIFYYTDFSGSSIDSRDVADFFESLR